MIVKCQNVSLYFSNKSPGEGESAELRVNMTDSMISLCESPQPEHYNCSHLNITEVSRVSVSQGQALSPTKLGENYFQSIEIKLLKRLKRKQMND